MVYKKKVKFFMMLFSDILSYKKNIILFIHNNPDGDSIGSSLAFLFFLQKFKHTVYIISPTNYSNSFKWIVGIEKIIVFSEKNKNFIQNKISKADYLFFIDFNNLSRIENIKYILELYTDKKKILIDHHPIDSNYNFEFFDLVFFDSSASATSILIYRFIESMNSVNRIDKNISICLYIALLTDTGFFKFSSVNSESHFIAGKLIQIGKLDITYIHNKLQDKYHEGKLNIISIALNKLKIIHRYRTAYTSIDYLDIKYKYQQGDTEKIIYYGLNTENVVFSVFFFREKREFPIKISFRSIGNFNVNLFARKHFNGGGHKNASGGIMLNRSLNETIDYFLNIIPLYYDSLKYSFQ